MGRRQPDDVPTPARREFESRVGLEWLRCVQRGEIVVPGAFADLGVRLVEVTAGRVVSEMTLEARHLNAFDIVFGGTIAALADMAAGLTVISVTPAGVMAPTLEVKVNFVRPAVMSAPVLRAEGTVLSMGRITALTEVRMTDRDGLLLAYATCTAALMPIATADASQPRA